MKRQNRITECREPRTIESERDWRAHFDANQHRVELGDLFRQVGRTINGNPVSAEEISLVVDAARSALELGDSDCLLDICCGNGLVTEHLAATCIKTYGVDFSEFLIEVARYNNNAPGTTYIHASAIELTSSYFSAGQPTKVCMIAALQHFTVTSLERLLHAIENVAERSAPLFFADIPDVARLYHFYDTPERRADYERRRATGTEAIGTWWDTAHLADILSAHGYDPEIRKQDSRRSGAHYRFDLLAKRRRP